MLISQTLQRSFVFKQDNEDITLSDPNADLPTDQVLALYSLTYATLTTAKIEGPVVKKDKLVYRFVTTIGSKG
jgi:PRTRC genetic system protein C